MAATGVSVLSLGIRIAAMLRISFGDEPKKGGAGPEEVQNSTGPQGPGTGQVPKTQNDLRPLLAQK